MGRSRWSQILTIGGITYVMYRWMRNRTRYPGMRMFNGMGSNMMMQFRNSSSRMMKSMRRMAR